MLPIRKIRCSMKRRIGIEVDAERGIAGALINSNRQIRNRPQGEIVCNNVIAGKPEPIIKPHDIDVQSERRPAISNSPKISSQVCNLIALVLESLANLRRGYADDF